MAPHPCWLYFIDTSHNRNRKEYFRMQFTLRSSNSIWHLSKLCRFCAISIYIFFCHIFPTECGLKQRSLSRTIYLILIFYYFFVIIGFATLFFKSAVSSVSQIMTQWRTFNYTTQLNKIIQSNKKTQSEFVYWISNELTYRIIRLRIYDEPLKINAVKV